MNFSSVLIVTYGRSGSTLLQGVLNSIDGCEIRGENYNFCYSLFESYQALLQSKTEYGSSAAEPTSPWYGANDFSAEKFIDDASKLVLNQLIPNAIVPDCIGFKEIRYINQGLNTVENGELKLHSYLNFLSKLFPNVALVFLTREHDEVLKSGWWQSQEIKKVKSKLAEFENNINDYSVNKTNTFAIKYEDVVNKRPPLQAMFDFLGAEYNEAIIDAVLAVKHSSETETKELVTEYEKIPGFIRYSSLDPLNPTKFNNMVLHGAILPNKVLKHNELIALDKNGEHQVDWQLPSPKLINTFPRLTHAANSRFKVTGLQISSEHPIKIYLKSKNGKLHLILTTFLK